MRCAALFHAVMLQLTWEWYNRRRPNHCTAWQYTDAFKSRGQLALQPSSCQTLCANCGVLQDASIADCPLVACNHLGIISLAGERRPACSLLVPAAAAATTCKRCVAWRNMMGTSTCMPPHLHSCHRPTHKQAGSIHLHSRRHQMSYCSQSHMCCRTSLHLWTAARACNRCGCKTSQLAALACKALRLAGLACKAL
jgi:hypothetical protein